MAKEDLEYKLDKLVKNLQGEIYNLMKDDNKPGDRECSEACGIVKAIRYINYEFGKNYETDLGQIICHYGAALQSKPRVLPR